MEIQDDAPNGENDTQNAAVIAASKTGKGKVEQGIRKSTGNVYTVKPSYVD